jgi:hypothetical protein
LLPWNRQLQHNPSQSCRVVALGDFRLPTSPAGGFAPVESSVILSVTLNRGGVTDGRGHGSRRHRLA